MVTFGILLKMGHLDSIKHKVMVFMRIFDSQIPLINPKSNGAKVSAWHTVCRLTEIGTTKLPWIVVTSHGSAANLARVHTTQIYQVWRNGFKWEESACYVFKWGEQWTKPLNTLKTYDCLPFCGQELVMFCVSRDVCITTMDEMAHWCECWDLIHAKWYSGIRLMVT